MLMCQWASLNIASREYSTCSVTHSISVQYNTHDDCYLSFVVGLSMVYISLTHRNQEQLVSLSSLLMATKEKLHFLGLHSMGLKLMDNSTGEVNFDVGWERNASKAPTMKFLDTASRIPIMMYWYKCHYLVFIFSGHSKEGSGVA